MQPLGTPARGGFTGAGVPYMTTPPTSPSTSICCISRHAPSCRRGSPLRPSAAWARPGTSEAGATGSAVPSGACLSGRRSPCAWQSRPSSSGDLRRCSPGVLRLASYLPRVLRAHRAMELPALGTMGSRANGGERHVRGSARRSPRRCGPWDTRPERVRARRGAHRERRTHHVRDDCSVVRPDTAAGHGRRMALPAEAGGSAPRVAQKRGPAASAFRAAPARPSTASRLIAGSDMRMMESGTPDGSTASHPEMVFVPAHPAPGEDGLNVVMEVR